MSINWVMLDEQKDLILLPKERILYTSLPRTTFSLTTPNTYPSKAPLSIQSSGGKAFVTNQRIIYLPSSPASTSGTPGVAGQLQSFAAPLLSTQDSRVTAPFFGPNAWVAVVRPVAGGGIPANHIYVELKLVFKDGGAFDFHSTYERVREQVIQAADVARETGRDVRDAMGDVGGEELPAYEGPAESSFAAPTLAPAPAPAVWSSTVGSEQPHLLDQDQDLPSSVLAPVPSTQGRQFVPPPNEPPPGYDDVQHGSAAERLEESVRREAA